MSMNHVCLVDSKHAKDNQNFQTAFICSICTSLVFIWTAWKWLRFEISTMVDTCTEPKTACVCPPSFESITGRFISVSWVLDWTIASRNNCNGLLLTLDCGSSPTNFYSLSTIPTVVVILRASDFSNYSTDDDLEDSTTDGSYVNNRLAIWCATQVQSYRLQTFLCIEFCAKDQKREDNKLVRPPFLSLSHFLPCIAH